jgi:hypothetical protein
MKQRRGYGGETMMVQVVNLCSFKTAQASTDYVTETEFIFLATESSSFASQTGLENLGRNKHGCASPWP